MSYKNIAWRCGHETRTHVVGNNKRDADARAARMGRDMDCPECRTASTTPVFDERVNPSTGERRRYVGNLYDILGLTGRVDIRAYGAAWLDESGALRTQGMTETGARLVREAVERAARDGSSES